MNTAAITSSEYWNEEYENYDVRTEEAKKELSENGYICWATANASKKKYTDLYVNFESELLEGMTETGLNALVGFDKNEPDYGRYHHDWEAKEAMPSYTPNLQPIYFFDEKIFIENLKKATKSNVDWHKERINSILSSQTENKKKVETESQPHLQALANLEQEIRYNPRARKYPYLFTDLWQDEHKFTTQEEAIQYASQHHTNRLQQIQEAYSNDRDNEYLAESRNKMKQYEQLLSINQ